MAASSPEGDSLVWKTTPKDPFPTILHCVYWISLVSPVMPSCAFSRMISVQGVLSAVSGEAVPTHVERGRSQTGGWHWRHGCGKTTHLPS